MMNQIWGQTLSLDLGECDILVLTNPEKLKLFSKALCKEIEMIPHGEPLVERFGEGELEGYSLMQFIETSSITVHCDEIGLRVFIDIFSCKRFDSDIAREFCKRFFKAKTMRFKNWERY